MTKFARYMADPNALAVGESTLPRHACGSVTPGTGTLRLTSFLATKTETVTSLRTVVASTAATGVTLARMGLYAAPSGGGAWELLAATANDATLYGSVATGYTRALSAPVRKVAGQRYAVGVIVVGTTSPALVGMGNSISIDLNSVEPRVTGGMTGQTDLPASLVSGSMGQSGMAIYAALLP